MRKKIFRGLTKQELIMRHLKVMEAIADISIPEREKQLLSIILSQSESDINTNPLNTNVRKLILKKLKLKYPNFQNIVTKMINKGFLYRKNNVIFVNEKLIPESYSRIEYKIVIKTKEFHGSN